MHKWIICSIEFNCKMLEMNYNLQTLGAVEYTHAMEYYAALEKN